MSLRKLEEALLEAGRSRTLEDAVWGFLGEVVRQFEYLVRTKFAGATSRVTRSDSNRVVLELRIPVYGQVAKVLVDCALFSGRKKQLYVETLIEGAGRGIHKVYAYRGTGSGEHASDIVRAIEEGFSR